jgi:hypothetical protein
MTHPFGYDPYYPPPQPTTTIYTTPAIQDGSLVEELRKMNRKMDKIIDLLKKQNGSNRERR